MKYSKKGQATKKAILDCIFSKNQGLTLEEVVESVKKIGIKTITVKSADKILRELIYEGLVHIDSKAIKVKESTQVGVTRPGTLFHTAINIKTIEKNIHLYKRGSGKIRVVKKPPFTNSGKLLSPKGSSR